MEWHLIIGLSIAHVELEWTQLLYKALHDLS